MTRGGRGGEERTLDGILTSPPEVPSKLTWLTHRLGAEGVISSDRASLHAVVCAAEAGHGVVDACS